MKKVTEAISRYKIGIVAVLVAARNRDGAENDIRAQLDPQI